MYWSLYVHTVTLEKIYASTQKSLLPFKFSLFVLLFLPSLFLFSSLTVAIINISNNTEIDAGTTATFVCVASGTPTPGIIWLKENIPLDVDGRINITENAYNQNDITLVSSVLEIHDTQSGDTGTYTCLASVSELEVTASFNLTVITASALITEPPNNETVRAGDNVTLTCIATGIPLPSITWLVLSQDSEEVMNTSSTLISTSEFTEDGITSVRSTLLITSVQTSLSYSCVASNDYGTDITTAYITSLGN